MASASVATDPIQKLFVDKIREIKSSNKGLDATHEKALKDEMLRLKRVFSIDDENKLAHLDTNFSSECDVHLRDLDTSKELREKIHSGEYQKKLASESKPKSAILATTPDQTPHDMCLPPLNKPDPAFMIETDAVMGPVQVGKHVPDYESSLEKMTPEKLEREFLVHFGENMPKVQDDGPQRDKVNFPRMPQLLDTPPTRHHIVPESWFQFFYPKTGVTGPYTFALSFGTFLMSKEWLVMEHELLTAITSTAIFAYAIPKYGPNIRKWFLSQIKKNEDDWKHWQEGNIKTLGEIAAHYKKQFDGAELLDDLYTARKQDVELQLEAEYRRRVKSVYEDTKRRLNYLVAVADSQRQIHHSNLVNMVISNVMSSFGPKQESEVLDDCINNLKVLSKKNANVV